jgi:hypothetical protein
MSAKVDRKSKLPLGMIDFDVTTFRRDASKKAAPTSIPANSQADPEQENCRHPQRINKLTHIASINQSFRSHTMIENDVN